ncbi:MAG: response regulator [Leptospiraceae bacterium]|nr:response regulator [Leptospiraceae bacterium]MDW8307026.1 response regulator [Leptospiraceae bacterium]
MAKILIVEDEYVLTMLYEVVLEQRGHEVVGIAPSLAQAQEKLTEFKPDLVILDLHLKNNENGLELIETIQKAKAKIIVVTSDHRDEIHHQIQQKGVDRVFTKPLNRYDFLRAIEELSVN